MAAILNRGMARLAPGVARRIHRVSSSAADVLPAAFISWLNRLPAADVLLIAPRTARAVIDVQHPDRPRASRVQMVTPRTVGEALVDEVALSLLKGNQTAGAPEHVEAALAVADALAAAERGGAVELTPRAFCPAPPAPLVVANVGTVRFRDIEATELAFPSEFEAPGTFAASARWVADPTNADVRLFFLEHADDAPWLVNIHGFRQGSSSDLFLFRSAALRDRFGVNVVHPILPASGVRSSRNTPTVPSADLPTTVVGLAQAAWDVRRTIRWIRSRSDAPIVLHGVSLGAYVASLVAGLEADLAGVVAGLPVVDYPAIMRRHAERMNLPERDLDLAAQPGIELLFRPVSPLLAPPRVPQSQRFVYAGKVDRISSEFQARSLWEHWDQCSIHWFEGGHLGGALWDRSVKQYIDDAIASILAASPTSTSTAA